MPKPTDDDRAGAPAGTGYAPTPLRGIGLALLGAGLGLQGASLFRLASRVGLGTPWDERVFGLVFAGLIGLGALLFGPLARARPPWGWIAAATAAAGSLFSLAVIAATTTPLGFKAHCARFGSDASLAGTPLVDGSAALVMLILPGFGLGAVLASRGRRSELIAIALGMVIGWFGHSLSFEAMELIEWKNAGSAGLVLHGALIAGLGIALGAVGIARLSGLGLAAAAAFMPISSVGVYPPWQRFPVTPLEIFETPRGQYTVLPTGTGGRQVFLDQRALSPVESELALEAACLQQTAKGFAQAGISWAPRTLVIGLLTPERADLLAAFGIDQIGRSALWYEDMERVERAAGWQTPAPGDVIPPSELGSMDFDLVLSFPTGTYASAGWDLGLLAGSTARVKSIWLPGDVGIQAAPKGARLTLASKGIERFAFGWTRATPADIHAPAPNVDPMTLARMYMRPEARPLEALREVASGAEPALARHAAAQRISSPFESPLEQVELVPEALALWRDRALASTGAPGVYLRGVLEGAGAVMMAQMEVPGIFEFLAPVAERFPELARLQEAVAWAEAQEFQFQAAVDRLRPLVAALPDRRDLGIALSDALVALGDPEGRAVAQALLRDDPENPQLFGLARGMRGMTTLATPGGYESLSQEEALTLADGAVLGTVVGVSVQEVDAGDGAPLFLSTLRVSGTELATGEQAVHEVIFLGGFTGPEHGTFNSSAPPAHRTRRGRRVFYYYQTQTDIAGGVPGHALLRGRAGLFTAFETRAGEVIVQGRGNAAAIPYNLVRDQLPAPH